MNRDEDFQDAVRVELARKVVRLKRRVAELERGGEVERFEGTDAISVICGECGTLVSGEHAANYVRWVQCRECRNALDRERTGEVKDVEGREIGPCPKCGTQGTPIQNFGSKTASCPNRDCRNLWNPDAPDTEGREGVCPYCLDTGYVQVHPLDREYDGEPCANCTRPEEAGGEDDVPWDAEESINKLMDHFSGFPQLPKSAGRHHVNVLRHEIDRLRRSEGGESDG